MSYAVFCLKKRDLAVAHSRVDGVLQDYPDPPAGNLAAVVPPVLAIATQIAVLGPLAIGSPSSTGRSGSNSSLAEAARLPFTRGAPQCTQ